MKTQKSETKKQEAAVIGARIRQLRKDAGLSLQEIAERLNRDFNANANKGMISKYENGIHEPSAGTLYCLSRIFGVSSEYLSGRLDEMQVSSGSGSNVQGQLLTIYTIYNTSDGGDLEEDTIELIPSQWLIGGHEFFGLRITGSEFAPRYYDGDLIIFERCCRVRQDRVALVSIGKNNAFLCHIVRKRTGKSFVPIDRKLDELYFSTEELEQADIRILGAAVQVRRME